VNHGRDLTVSLVMNSSLTQPPQVPILVADSVRIDRPAVADVHLRIDGSQIGVIVGPNGSGKSALLRVLAGLDVPTGGQVTATGSRLLLTRDKFDQGKLAGEALRSVLDDCSTPGERSAWLERLDVPSRRVEQLSDGELSRLLVAGAAASRSSIVLVDSPMAFLDGDGREVAYGVLKSCAEAGRIVVLATVDVDLLVNIDEAGLWRCNGGQVVQVRRPSSLDQPLI